MNVMTNLKEEEEEEDGEKTNGGVKTFAILHDVNFIYRYNCIPKRSKQMPASS